jgi:hypothetical protein
LAFSANSSSIIVVSSHANVIIFDTFVIDKQE